MNEKLPVPVELKDMTEFDPNYGRTRTSIERIQDILEMSKDEKSGITMVFTIDNAPSYDSRKTHYGQVGASAANTINEYKIGDKLWEQCPIIYYTDGGIEFIEGFGGTATESPSSIVIIVPPQGKAIKYWQKITNEKIREYLINK